VFFIAQHIHNAQTGKEDMTTRIPKAQILTSNGDSCTLKFMELQQVSMIDEALTSLGDYGEVRLIVEKGKLRFLVTQKSFDALKWQPGEMSG
jgi:hypothetical protein